MGDAHVDERRRWGVVWVHHQAEELRVHHRATIAPEAVRAMVVAVLASRRVPPMQAPLPSVSLSGSRPFLRRFWSRVCQHDETVYLILFLNDQCLVLAPSR